MSSSLCGISIYVLLLNINLTGTLIDWHCHAMTLMGVRKRNAILSNCPFTVDEAAVFTIPCCVLGCHVYQRMWIPFVGEVATTIRDPDSTSDRYTEYIHCILFALALRGIQCVIFLIRVIV